VCRRNQAQRATGAPDAPCGAPARWSPRLGRTCTQASPAQRPPESGPGLTIRALGVPSRTGHERSRAVNHGSCRSALTSQFGVGAGPSLALDSTFQARDPGATSGPHPIGRSRTTAGHWRSTDPAAQPSLSVIIAGRPISSTLSRTEEVRGSNPLTSTPNLPGQSVASAERAALTARCGRTAAASASPSPAGKAHSDHATRPWTSHDDHGG